MTTITVAIVLGIAFVAVHLLLNKIAEPFQFARLVRKRGITPSVVREFSAEQGLLVLDHVYGASIGIGTPTVWWSEEKDEHSISLYDLRLVDIPRKQRNLESLRNAFPNTRIIESSMLQEPPPLD